MVLIRKWCRYRTAYDNVFDRIAELNSGIVSFHLGQLNVFITTSIDDID